MSTITLTRWLMKYEGAISVYCILSILSENYQVLLYALNKLSIKTSFKSHLTSVHEHDEVFGFSTIMLCGLT